MMNYPGETVRENYRKQGEARIVDRIIQNLMNDAGLQLNWSTQDMAYIVNIVEGSLKNEARPNN